MAEDNRPSSSQKAYKIVLAGDAAVGKSSFLMRLCKNEFRGNTSATLGMVPFSDVNGEMIFFTPILFSLRIIYRYTDQSLSTYIYRGVCVSLSVEWSSSSLAKAQR